MLASRSLSLLILLKLLKKATTGLEFTHLIGAEGVCKTFFANITRCGCLLIELRHFKITTLVGAKNWSHRTSMSEMVYQIVKRNLLTDATPINTSEDETSLHFIFILLWNFNNTLSICSALTGLTYETGQTLELLWLNSKKCAPFTEVFAQQWELNRLFSRAVCNHLPKLSIWSRLLYVAIEQSYKLRLDLLQVFIVKSRAKFRRIEFVNLCLLHYW